MIAMRTRELADDGSRMGLAMTGLSILCHIVVVAGIIFGPSLRMPSRKVPDVISVDLMRSMPSAARSEGARAPAQPAPRPQPAAIALKAPEPAVKPAPSEVAVKRSLKKLSFKPEKVLASAIKNMEETVESKQSVKDAIEKMKRAALDQAGGISVATGQEGGETGPLQTYLAELRDHVNQNWACPPQLVGRAGIKAEVSITVERNGAISDADSDIFFIRSGNPAFDDSVARAVKKSDPAPPFPPELTDRNLMVVLGFEPPGNI